MAKTTKPKASSTTAKTKAKTAAAPAKPAGTAFKKKDLFDEVVARTNLKKRDVKPAVEAALALIADTLQDGRDVMLPPMGKLRVVKTKDVGDGAAVLTLKLRTPKNATTAANSGVAPDGDAD